MAKPANKIEKKEIIQEPNIEQKNNPISPTLSVNKRITIDDREMIRIINNKTGCLNYSNRLGSVRWDIQNYGDDIYMDFKDLRELRSLYPALVNDMWLVIDNEDVINFWNLNKNYSTLVRPDEVDEFFSLDIVEIKEKLKKMNPICQNTLAEVAYIKYVDGQLDSIKIQRAIEDALNKKIFNLDM